MKGRLLYRDAQGRDASADVQPEGSFVGRAQECVVRTDDAMVSRRNYRLWLESGAWFVEDLGSSNGTFVNDQRVQKQQLRHADIVRCGTLQVRFVIIDDKPSSRIAVDPGLMEESGELDLARRELESVLADRSAKEQQLFDLGRELDALRSRSETDSAELQRLRAEVAIQRDKFSELSRIRQSTDEELNATLRVSEQLRTDIDSLRKEHIELRDRHDKASGDLQARDRQLERSLEDVQRTKHTLDEARGRLVELERTKDAGWRELNNRAGELDGLRAVISEQERLLEERRVGLIALESSAQELRQEKERTLRELVITRTERDDAKQQLVAMRNQLEGLDEEHRRLQRKVADGTGGTAEEALQLASDLRQARVAQKTLEAERDRLLERAERADAARTLAEQKVANLDVERTHALEEKQRAISARERAEEALQRAELQRQASEDSRRMLEDTSGRLMGEIAQLRRELDEANQRAMQASQEAIEARKDADLARKRSDAAKPTGQRGEQVTLSGDLLEAATGSDLPTGPISGDLEESTWGGGEDGRRHAAPAEIRIRELEEELSLLGSDLAIARAELEASAPTNGTAGIAEIQRRAEAAHDGVNDALSELRTHVLLAQRLVEELGADGEATRSLKDAITASVERTEEAKNVLRTLREVV